MLPLILSIAQYATAHRIVARCAECCPRLSYIAVLTQLYRCAATGSFQFRFKYQIESNYIWLDVNEPNATVPRYGRNIYMKVLYAPTTLQDLSKMTNQQLRASVPSDFWHEPC